MSSKGTHKQTKRQSSEWRKYLQMEQTTRDWSPKYTNSSCRLSIKKAKVFSFYLLFGNWNLLKCFREPPRSLQSRYCLGLQATKSWLTENHFQAHSQFFWQDSQVPRILFREFQKFLVTWAPEGVGHNMEVGFYQPKEKERSSKNKARFMFLL